MKSPVMEISSFEELMERRSLFRKKEYTHKHFEKEIPDFLNDRLLNKELARFLEHLDRCEICQDELSTQYLVMKGLPKLETGETFNLNQELGEYVELEKNRLVKRDRLGRWAYGIELVTLLLVFSCIVAGFLLELY